MERLIIRQKQGTRKVSWNEKEQQRVTIALCDTDNAVNLSTLKDNRKRGSILSFSEVPVKKRQTGKRGDTTGALNTASPSSESYTWASQPCTQDMGPTEQDKKYKKENTPSMQHKYSPVYNCNEWVTAGWKAFVEDETLVTLSEALYYLTASKLGNYDVCVKYRIKLALKLQLQKVDDILTLLTRVESIWKYRNWKTLRQFVEMKCRQA